MDELHKKADNQDRRCYLSMQGIPFGALLAITCFCVVVAQTHRFHAKHSAGDVRSSFEGLGLDGS
jgi:hypothetical protein